MLSRARTRPYLVVLFAAALTAGLFVLPRLQSVGFALFLTVVFALVLDAPVSALVRRGLNRPAAVGLVVTGFIAALAGLVALIVPTVTGQFDTLSLQHGSLAAELAARLNQVASHAPVALPRVTAAHLNGDRLFGLLQRYHVFESTGEALLLVLFSAFTAVWAVANPRPLQRRLLLFLPAGRRAEVARIARVVEERLRRWIVGQLVLCGACGLASYTAFRVLGVPYAELFGVLAAVLELVPTAGVLLSSLGPAVLLLLDNPTKVLWLVAAVVVIHQAEDRFLVPYVMRRALDIPQAFLAFVMLTFGVLFGPAGLVLAVPLAAAAITVHDEVRGIRDTSAADPATADSTTADPVTDDPVMEDMEAPAVGASCRTDEPPRYGTEAA